MLIQILLNTPSWVFAVFALLLVLGSRQLIAHRVPLGRATIVPLVMIGLAVWGVLSALRNSPAGLLALLAWAGVAALMLVWVARRALPAATHFEPATRSFRLPGSAVPLALMMAIFLTKYAVGVLMALHPQLSHHSAFALGVSALYGLFSGVFAGRAWRLIQLARASDQARSIASPAL